MKVLVLDNIDSFTYMLVDYLRQAGADCKVFRNTEPLQKITAEAYDAVVLSPGPGTPGQAGCLPDLISYYHKQLPMLGVCLGHQALGEFFGATLDKAATPMHGKRSEVRKRVEDPIFDGIPASFQVTRYHSLIVRELPNDLVALAETVTDAGGQENMMFRHQKLPIYGVQFHPEAALTEFGLEILKNWITFAKTAK